MTDSRIEERLARVEGRQDIAHLVAEYSHGADKRQLDRFLAVWHDDAIWDVGVRRFKGPAEIGQAVEHQWSQQPFMAHWTSNVSIDLPLGSTRARAEVDADVITQASSGDWYHSAGTYEDTYEQRAGRWALGERIARVHFTHALRCDHPGCR